MRPDGYYTSGEFAKMAHISVRTVRFYDKQNILKPSYVNETGARFYSEEDFVRLQQILLLKYLGFSLEDIRDMTVEDPDHQMLKNSLNLQLKLVKDRVEQMQMVAAAIEDVMEVIEKSRNIDWRQMLNLIHLTNMETSLKSQYQNANNIAARINLHKLFSANTQGWFPWVYEHCGITEGMEILELGCGNGAIWRENYKRIPKDTHIVLNDISEGMLWDTRRELEQIECAQSGQYDMPQFDIRAFDCHEIPFENGSFDCIIANHVLFYCDDLQKALSEVKRVLKQDGVFICSSYGAAHMQEITELVKGFHSMITLSADKLYEHFGMDNGEEILKSYFSQIEKNMYEDSLLVDQAEPLIEYILSCHGNQNQYILSRYKEFRSYVEKKTEKNFQITKEAGIFICRK